VDLVNTGRLAVVPLVEITGGDVTLVFGESTWTLSAGSYRLPDMRLTQGAHRLIYSGRAGNVRITFREAVL
jgi:hypothetical protein